MTMSQLTTFYDGGCPLCRQEISHYRRLDVQGAINWVDITSDDATLATAGLDRNTAMRRIHAHEVDGTLLVGVPAFIAIWRRLPRYRHLATLVQGLRLTRLLDWAYGHFADWRFRRRCRDGACSIE